MAQHDGQGIKTSDKRLAVWQGYINEKHYSNPWQLHSDKRTNGVSLSTLQVYQKQGRLVYAPAISKRDMVTLYKLKANFAPKELNLLADKGQIKSALMESPMPKINFTGTHVRWASMTDTHMGGKVFHDEHWDGMLKAIKAERCEFVTHSGDITNGMKNSTSDELEVGGFDGQAKYSAERIGQITVPFYFVSGNHDRWVLKQNDADICASIRDRLLLKGKKAHYLGHDEADINLKGAILRLFHGEDGSSYAVSYRFQKLAEAYTGGEKPDAVVGGHVHKMCYIFDRHIHMIGGGAVCTQSRWMRAKRLANHSGFWIIDAWVNKTGISKFSPTWYPFYA